MGVKPTAGIYIAHLVTPEFTNSIKMLLSRRPWALAVPATGRPGEAVYAEYGEPSPRETLWNPTTKKGAAPFPTTLREVPLQ